MKKYIIRLSTEERENLKKLITSGRGPARMFTRARILLKADQSVERIRKQLVEEGCDAVLSRRKYTQKVSRKKIDGDIEAHLIALSCSEPPPGRARWTFRLLADSIVELGHVQSISHEAVRRTLKKTKLNRG